MCFSKIVLGDGISQLSKVHKWFVYKELDQAAKAAADFIALSIENSIQQHNICHVALPGGNTPKYCLTYLADKDLPWDKIHWYLGDERCAPKGDAQRNDVMLEKYLWSKITETHVHRIPTEMGAEDAAAAYRDVIAGFDHFDIAFLGIGEDGHTASLFPGNAALDDTRSVIPVYNSPKPPSERVTLSVETLKRVLIRVVLSGGKEKASIVARIKTGEVLPINSLGDIFWYVDEAAVAESI